MRNIGIHLLEFIFGRDGSTQFCKRQDRPCEVTAGKGRSACNKAGNAICFRTRPSFLVAVVHPRVWEEAFQRLGRSALFLRYEEPTLDDLDKLIEFIQSNEETIRSVKHFITNLRSNMLAPQVPHVNFQNKSGHFIAEEAQKNPERFQEIMESHHKSLYNRQFRNPRKRNQRGAYMFGDEVGFQKDLLHSFAHIGDSSRADVYHLINAYHLYGAPILPGFHFDVLTQNDSALGVRFEDIVTHQKTDEAAKHVNLSPCDRIV